jgi:hypothetical protein
MLIEPGSEVEDVGRSTIALAVEPVLSDLRERRHLGGLHVLTTRGL